MKKVSLTKKPNVEKDAEETLITHAEVGVEALKILYEGKLSTLRFLAERSFTTTLQTITLNVIVLAGLIAGKITLLNEGKILGSILLIVFNALVMYYLIFKGRDTEKKGGW